MKILYLYSEVMGYTMATIRALVDRGAEVHVVRRDRQNQTPYAPPDLKQVFMYNRSELSVDALHTLVEKLCPSVTVVSGWVDKGYLAVAKRQKNRGGVVVTGLDGQWYQTTRQRLASWIGYVGYFTKFFSHAWIAGTYQYEYARKLGFEKSKIVSDLYSADLNLFHQAYRENVDNKKINYPHRFLFVGRLEPVKGIDTLLKAWKLMDKHKHDWELHLIGNGSLKGSLTCTPGIVVKEFMQPGKLMKEVAKAGCFVLPSREEPWGVVVHEFTAAGLPLIVSDVVGSASSFLISGMNGFSFSAGNPYELASRMAKITSMTDLGLFEMSMHSHRLSHRITPESSAANLLSLLH